MHQDANNQLVILRYWAAKSTKMHDATQQLYYYYAEASFL